MRNIRLNHTDDLRNTNRKEEKPEKNKDRNTIGPGNEPRNDSDGNSNIGPSNEFNTDVSRSDASRTESSDKKGNKPEDIF